jgi:GrpB-like predicted nucleotidyltransferase (UPF0157 family)
LRIVIADYNPDWPAQFDREAELVRGVLGRRVVRLEHVGSTSVPGLPAKPIIDMLLVVADSSDEPAYVPDLLAAGYVLRHREPDWFEHRMFKGPSSDINLHVFSDGCSEVARMLLFRDWLRSHAHERDLYLQTKLALAQREWPETQAYADAKTEVVKKILTRADKDRVN